MKKILFFVCTLLCANVLFAQVGTTFGIGNIQYKITSTNPAKVEVNDANESITTADIPTTVSYEGINYSVTSIGAWTFYNCSSLTSVTIPNSVTSIGNYAFSDCLSLTSITIPNSVTSIGSSAFNSCYGLTSVIIPNSVTSIGNYAFSVCNNLTSVTIGNSVTSIGSGAFEFCSRLTSVTCLAETAPSLGSSVFSSTQSTKTLTYPCGATGYSTNWGNTTWESVECTLDLGNSLTYFPLTFAIISEGERTMKVSDCDVSATDVEIPARVMYNGELYTVTSIGDYAFKNCSSLTSITIPNSVTSIGNWAFDSCSSLTSVTIPNSVTSIRGSAFRNCSSLTPVTIPNSVTSIGDYAFSFCRSLTSVILPNNANIHSDAFKNTGGINVDGISYGGKETVNIGNYTFNNVGFITFYLDGNATTITPSEVSVIDCDESLSGDIVIPSILSYEGINYSVTSIGIAAFEYCSSLTSVTIPNSVTSIGYQAFYNCSSLTSIDIPNSVTSIGGYAFNSCSSLTSVTIPNSVTSIEYGAFSSCSSLTSITIPNSVTSIGYSAFRYCSSLTSVTIPNSVTSIGDWAFEDCTSLTSVTIGNSVTSIGARAFADCDSLTSVTIGNSVTSIEVGAFLGCSSLTSVTCLAETAPSLGNNVFSSTPSTKVLNIPCGSDYSSWESATTWASVNEDCPALEIGEQFTIGDFTYEVTSANEVAVKTYNNNTATSTEIPSTVTYQGTTYSVTFIQNKAFYNKDNLTSVTIPNTVIAIGGAGYYGAFEECDGLTSITIPSSVTSIGSNTFFSCSSLTSVDIPNSVTTIGSGAFWLCDNLTSINIPNSVTSIGSYAFSACSALTSVTIPNSVTSIRSYAFKNCSSLTSVTLPNNANIYSDAFENAGVINVDGIYYGGAETVNIENYTFNNVGFITFYLDGNAYTPTLTEVSVVDCDVSKSGDITIPQTMNGYSVTSIGNDAFFSCSSLTSVTIPNSVTSIGSWAFGNCSSLDSVICLAKTAPTLDVDAFRNTPSTKTLTIPFGSDYSSWQSATTWSKTNYLIQEGKTKELSNDFTINSTTGLINQGVLRIKQGGQLINQTATNVEGIIEIEAINRENNWNYIGAPFANNYQLGAILPQANDVSVSTFNHNTGNWNTNWATNETEIPTGEGFAAWNWGASPITFTTYGDIWNYETNQAGGYNFEQDPTYTLNNQPEITITHQDNNSEDNVNWLSVANPYTFKLDVEKIINQNSLQGNVLYKYNGTTFIPVSSGEIQVTEGFFVNNQSITLNKAQQHTLSAKTNKQKDYIRLAVNDGENEIELQFTQNDKANANYDRFDANKLFSPLEITEPYFVTDGKALVKEEVKELPYTATLNIKSYENKDITIKITNIPEGVNVYLLDNGQDTKMNGGVEYTTNITAGENADRFKILFKPQQKLETKQNNHITINNHNRHITITSTITDLHIEVYNTLGQKVHTTKDYTFTLDHLPSGSYLIKAFKGRQTKTEKIVIE